MRVLSAHNFITFVFNQPSFQQEVTKWYADEYRVVTDHLNYDMSARDRSLSRSVVTDRMQRIKPKCSIWEYTDDTRDRLWSYPGGLSKNYYYFYENLVLKPKLNLKPSIRLHGFFTDPDQELVAYFMELNHKC